MDTRQLGEVEVVKRGTVPFSRSPVLQKQRTVWFTSKMEGVDPGKGEMNRRIEKKHHCQKSLSMIYFCPCNGKDTNIGDMIVMRILSGGPTLVLAIPFGVELGFYL